MPTSSDSSSSEEHKDDINQIVENPALPSEPSPAETLPPEAQGETNGGPLGCCLGIMVGLVLSLSIAVFSRFYADPLSSLLHNNLSIAVRIVMVIVALIAVIICGYFGWKIGKVIYREYDDPRLKQKRRRRKRTPPKIS